MIPFIDLSAQQARIRPLLDAAVQRVMDHGAYIMGPEVRELEERLAGYAGVRHAVSCASGTDALVLALMAHEIGSGDAVVVPTFTFAATAEAVALLGATPVFVDIDRDTYNIDPKSLDDAVAVAQASGLRPRAVVAVDLFGQPADYAALGDWCARSGLLLVGDAAQSFGATWDGRRVGALSPITTTSFFPAKPLGCYGDGGAVFTDDDDVATVLRSLRVHGQGTHKYENVRIGINGRLDTLQAAILLVKLEIFDDELQQRSLVAARYTEALRGVTDVPVVHPAATSAWAQYTVRVDNRDAAAAALKAAGVPTAVYYPVPLHRQPAYASFPTAGSLDVSEAHCETVLSLPMHPYLDADAQDTVIAALVAVVGS